MLWISLKLPYKIVSTTLSWLLFFATGFYCCGLCRRRSKANKGAKGKGAKTADAKGQEANGKEANGKEASGKESSDPYITQDEVAKLLDQAQKQGKLQAAAVQFSNFAQNQTQ